MINKFNIKLITKLLHINQGLLKLKLPNNKELHIGEINSEFIAELNIHSWQTFNKIIKEGSNINITKNFESLSLNQALTRPWCTDSISL